MSERRHPRRRAGLQQDGLLSLVSLEGSPGATIQSRLDEIGLGRYQLMVLAGVGGALMSESLEMGSVAPMHTAFARVYGLTHRQRALLPMVTFAGSGIGLLISGPVCDWQGRKTALVSSLVIIAGVMFATALLPVSLPPEILLMLRFLAGLAGAIQVPAGCVLAVESCPMHARSKLVFGIQTMGCVGYMLEAICMLFFMPHFGEAIEDHWRGFCLLIGGVSLAALPLAAALYESPSFLAVKGDADGCVEALEGMARINTRHSTQDTLQVSSQGSFPPAGLSHGSLSPDNTSPVPDRRLLLEVARIVVAAVSSHWALLTLLSFLDTGRSFFVSGSSYLWKDLLSMAQGHVISPAMLNVIASLAPLIGLAISQKFLWMGVRYVAFGSAMLAATSLAMLTQEHLRSGMVPLLVCIMATKLAYGPLNTCIALIKAESFPTEIRVSAYSLVSVVAKVGSTLAPTLIEAWKGNADASSWAIQRLDCYLLCLIAAAGLCGLLVLSVPGQSGDGKLLRDFFEEKRVQRVSHYGSFGNIWELANQENADRMHRSHTSPGLMQEAEECEWDEREREEQRAGSKSFSGKSF